MQHTLPGLLAALTLVGGTAHAAPATLAPAEQAAAFKAAGAVQRHGKWVLCADDPDAAGATLDRVEDLNGDGRPDAILTEGGSYCYGIAGTAFWVLAGQPNGQWKLMAHSTGIPLFLKARGRDGWPDLSIGGPGFCFPVLRWDGKSYAANGFQYEGRACRP